MCNCKETAGFDEKLSQAKIKTIETGESHVVFILKPNGNNAVFMMKEANLTDELGICCYFRHDGTEILYEKKNKVIDNVTVEEVSDDEPQLLEPKKSASKTKKSV